MNIELTKTQRLLLCGGLIGLASLMLQACETVKVTLFRRSGVRRRLKPETYLLQREENGNLYMNTGFRIDVAYNEETDVLTFSPNGDYIRVNTDNASDDEKKEEQ